MASATASSAIEVKGNPPDLAWSPDDRRLFVSERGSGSVAEVDPVEGKAVTVQDLLTTENKADKHGKTSHLGREDLDAWAEFLLSL